MTARLLVLVPINIITFTISILWLSTGEGFPWFFVICTAFGSYGILRVIADHHRFKLVDNILVLELPLKKVRSINLKTVAEWRELAYNIRGQRRKTIILLFDQQEKVVVDNSVYKMEFNELLAYLTKNHASQKIESNSK